MRVTIVFCLQCGYVPIAHRIAEAVRVEIGTEPELVCGIAGVFDVRADGRLLFSKDREGRFPECREIVAALRAMRRGDDHEPPASSDQ